MMSNPWSGRVAKQIVSSKHSRFFWNIFWCVALLIILFATVMGSYHLASDHLTYEEDQIYLSYQDEVLNTDSASFEIVPNEKQEVNISELINQVGQGACLHLTISKVSNDLLEIKYGEKTVYRKSIDPIGPTVLIMVIVLSPMLALSIFFLIVTNIKHPSKRIQKLQNQYLLRYYK